MMLQIYHDKYNFSLFISKGNKENINTLTVVYNRVGSCNICGEPPDKKLSGKCHYFTHSFPFKLIFGGYYYTDFNNLPINPWGRLIYNLEDPLTMNIDLVYEIFKFRLSLFDKLKQIQWVTWIPSTNEAGIKIFKKVAKDFNWMIIQPDILVEYDLSLKTTLSNRKQMVKKKYRSKKLPEDTINKIEGRIGGIFDDFYFSGVTMDQFLSFLYRISIPQVYGITLGKIPHHKLRPMKFYP